MREFDKWAFLKIAFQYISMCMHTSIYMYFTTYIENNVCMIKAWLLKPRGLYSWSKFY